MLLLLLLLLVLLLLLFHYCCYCYYCCCYCYSSHCCCCYSCKQQEWLLGESVSTESLNSHLLNLARGVLPAEHGVVVHSRQSMDTYMLINRLDSERRDRGMQEQKYSTQTAETPKPPHPREGVWVTVLRCNVTVRVMLTCQQNVVSLLYRSSNEAMATLVKWQSP